jgi:hypothetical protein
MESAPDVTTTTMPAAAMSTTAGDRGPTGE